MYDIIKRYVENENDNGLLLVDMPTGSGKTYSAIEFIYNSCMNPNNKDRKYIFVTTLKKNLPYEDLKKRFVDSGNEELCQEKVLVIDSNIASIRKHISNCFLQMARFRSIIQPANEP